MRKHRFLGLVYAFLFFIVNVSSYAATPPSEIPSELFRWNTWVLYGKETSRCPVNYNDGTVVRCQWATRLQLGLSAKEGKFEQAWLVFADGWAQLPGGGELWPEGVTVDGNPAVVILRDNAPSIRLTPGDHRVMGRFVWQQIPEMIPLPASLGMLDVTLNGKEMQSPLVDDKGRLWLQERREEKAVEDELKVQVFRMLADDVPMQVTTLLRLYVSGKSREIEVEGGLIPAGTAMAIDSPLPARITDQGRLTLQARPGRWDVRILARLDGPQPSIDVGACVHGDEIWSFRPNHELRMVEILELPPIEPSQTEMPDEWRGLQAFLIRSGTAMVIKELRRGDPDPAPDQISLHRTFWLDFDGQGLTVHDAVSGTLNRQWHLAVNPPMLLGRVSVDGQNRVITEQGPHKKMGVELRRGRLDLAADARLPRTSGSLAAVGWDHDFQSVKAVLNLPPGWRLLSAAGVDSVSESWLQRWTLLDFFLVLIIAMAVYKVRSWQWGLVALVVMTLIFHEPGAPRLVWLHILVVLALLRLLTDGWFRRLVFLWGIGAMIVLLATTIPFVVKQIRWGIYPQLAPATDFYGAGDMGMNFGAGVSRQAEEDLLSDQADYPAEMELREEKASRILSKSMTYMDKSTAPRAAGPYEKKEKRLQQQDPDALIPTGPGLPNWRWRSINLSWNGPVSREQTITFYLLSPFVNLLLALLRAGLVVLLIWALIDWRSIRQRMVVKTATAATLLGVVMGAVLFQPALSSADTDGFPPQTLLDELQRRLIEKPDCLPLCADISRMELTAEEEDVKIVFQVHSAWHTAMPLPVNRKSWTPAKIVLDHSPAEGLTRDRNGQLWILMPAGLHLLVLTGSSRDQQVLQIPLPIRPHHATYSAKGWRVEGIHSESNVGESIQLTRLQPRSKPSADGRATAGSNTVLPPFLKIERALDLGLTWQTVTTITRLTPTGAPVVINVPLLSGEAVTTAGITVEKGHALINLAPEQRTAVYSANLKISSLIELKAPESVPWTETWVLAAGPVWHLDVDGIAPVHHQDSGGQWQPRWQPWPGEKVSIHIHRPAPVKAQTQTIDQAELTMTPGARFSQVELNLLLRTSRGGQHTIELPEKAELQQVTVNNRTLPVRQKGTRVTIPLQPGEQKLGLKWHHLVPFSVFFRVPQIKIGQETVNAKAAVNLPDQRWVLLAGGPRWGPAVLFWSYFIAIALAAFLLGRISLTPLTGWHWLLLGCGLTQVSAVTALIIASWLIALGLRKHRAMPQGWPAFNLIQIGLVIFTLVALGALFAAVKSGLIGMPEMQITGNQSSYRVLRWTQDHVQDALPRPWVFSLPVWVYRVLMLAWSLWLASALLKWLKWGWNAINTETGWRKVKWRRPWKKGPEAAAKEA